MRAGLVDHRAAKPHQKILDALISRDADRIRQEIRSHMETSYQGFLDTGIPSLDALVHSSSVNGHAPNTNNSMSHAVAS